MLKGSGPAEVAVGFVLARSLHGSALLHWDERVVASMALHRTSNRNRISLWWSRSADAPSVVAVAVVVGIVSAVRQRYREVVWLAVGLAVELGVFLTVSYSVHRPRPDVDHATALLVGPHARRRVRE